jgi:hypothetical protein
VEADRTIVGRTWAVGGKKERSGGGGGFMSCCRGRGSGRRGLVKVRDWQTAGKADAVKVTLIDKALWETRR